MARHRIEAASVRRRFLRREGARARAQRAASRRGGAGCCGPERWRGSALGSVVTGRKWSGARSPRGQEKTSDFFDLTCTCSRTAGSNPTVCQDFWRAEPGTRMGRSECAIADAPLEQVDRCTPRPRAQPRRAPPAHARRQIAASLCARAAQPRRRSSGGAYGSRFAEPLPGRLLRRLDRQGLRGTPRAGRKRAATAEETSWWLGCVQSRTRARTRAPRSRPGAATARSPRAATASSRTQCSDR